MIADTNKKFPGEKALKQLKVSNSNKNAQMRHYQESIKASSKSTGSRCNELPAAYYLQLCFLS